MAVEQKIIIDFTGGLNDSIDPDRLRDSEVADCLNVYPNDTGNIVNRDGQSQLTSNASAGASVTITSAFESTLSTGSTAVIATAETTNNFYYFATSGLTALKATAALVVATASASTYRWVFFNDNIIGVNRTSRVAVVWGGGTATVNLLSVASANSGITAPIDVAVWNRRVCLAQGTEIFISDVNEHEDWHTGDSFVARLRGGRFGEEEITAIHEFQGKLIIFKKNSIWSIDKGSGISDTFEIKQISVSIGCDAPDTIADTGRDLLFLNSAGVNSLSELVERGGLLPDGKISQKIHSTYISQINSTYISKAVAVFDPETDQYRVSFPTGSNTENDVTLCLSLTWTRNNKNPSWWVFDYGKNISCYIIRPSVKQQSLACGSYDGHLYRLDTSKLDHTTLYNKLIKTRRFVLGNPYFNKIFHEIWIDVTQDSSTDVLVKRILNQGNTITQYSFNIVGSGVAAVGTAIVGSEVVGGASIGVSRNVLSKISRDIQIEISLGSTKSQVTFNKIMFMYESAQDDLQSDLNA